MVEYIWSIDTTDFLVDEANTPTQMIRIHWRCEGTEGGTTRSTFGVEDVDLPYATTTEEECISIAQKENPSTEADLQAVFDLQAAPPGGTGVPWEEQFDLWGVGVDYEIGKGVNYQGVAYECIQAHTSQGGWTPDLTPALWKVIQDESGEDIPWIPGEDVTTGEIRIYEELTYSCLQPHTTQVGWEPPNVPALWEYLPDSPPE